MNPRPGIVLIVDDTRENLQVLGELLERDGHDVRIASDGAKALAIATAEPPSLILLDVLMPGMDGYEVCRQLKADPRTSDIPVIFLTALNAEADEALGLELGAVDYISKPFKHDLVRKRVANQLLLRQFQVELQEDSDRLEVLVAERTKQLSETNDKLRLLDSTKGWYLKLLGQELRAPANGIVGVAKLSVLSIEDKEKRLRLQELLENNSRRFEEILTNYQKLVALQEPGGLVLHPVRLEEVLEESFRRTNEAAASKDVRRTSLSPQGSFIISADTELLTGALVVLLRLVVVVAEKGTQLDGTLAETDQGVELTWVVKTQILLKKPVAKLDDLLEMPELANTLGGTLDLNLSLAGIAVTAFSGKVAVTAPHPGEWELKLSFLPWKSR